MNEVKQTFSVWRRRGGVALVAALACVVAGCGRSPQADPKRAAVSGVVTFRGKPLPAGTISFESANSPMASSALIDAGGKYSTDRVPIGACKVSVSTSSVRYGNPGAYVAIPEKYGDVATSGLTTDIKAGENENVNFQL
ncbi:MAG: hypothetical protein IT424_13515 [Pirellulales bacterium]|nr:hypothetical protein [Pirellulales bacterium]